MRTTEDGLAPIRAHLIINRVRGMRPIYLYECVGGLTLSCIDKAISIYAKANRYSTISNVSGLEKYAMYAQLLFRSANRNYAIGTRSLVAITHRDVAYRQ